MAWWVVVLIALSLLVGCVAADDSASPLSSADVDDAADPAGAPLSDQTTVQGAVDRTKAYLVPQLFDVEPKGVTVSFAVVTPAPGVTALVSTWTQDGASGAPRQQVLHRLPVVAGSDPPMVPMQPICDAAHQRDLVGVELRSVTGRVEVDMEHSRFLSPADDVCPGLAVAELNSAGLGNDLPALPDAAAGNPTTSSAAEVAAVEVPLLEPLDPGDGAATSTGDAPMLELSDPGNSADRPPGPPAGAILDMIGVRPDDFLNVRNMPGGEIVARLRETIWQPVDWRFMLYGPDIEPEDIRRDGPFAGLLAEPTETEIVATGNTRRLLDSLWHPVWYEIEVGGVTGWASGQHLGVLGQNVLVVDEVASVLGGVPSADSLQLLATVVIETVIPEYDPGSWSVILRSGPGVIESSGDLVVDVVTVRDGLPVGYQLGIVADNHGDCLTIGDCETRCCDWTSDYGAPFTLRYASIKPICDSAAGVTPAGACA